MDLNLLYFKFKLFNEDNFNKPSGKELKLLYPKSKIFKNFNSSNSLG